MLSFLFWNLNRKPLTRQVIDLVKQYNVDVLMLAESSISDEEFIPELIQATGRTFHKPFSLPGKIQIYTSLPEHEVQPVYDSTIGRLTIRRLVRANTDILLAVLHLPSKVNWSDESQAVEARKLAEVIRQFETRANHQRTVVVGDFNMNPFETGLISTDGFHAVMTKEIALQLSRTVQATEYFYFYNPMWGNFGDRTEGPPGTHFYGSSEHVACFWNMYDQVLIRPELLNGIFKDDLKIVSSIGDRSLATATGKPDGINTSDHFPIWFGLHL